MNTIPDGLPELLPNDIEARPVMSEVLEAYLLPRFKHLGEEQRVSHVWLSEACEQLVLLFVWHAVCKHITKNKQQAKEEGLFALFCTKHAVLFASDRITADAKDSLAWLLPEALSRCAMSALGQAYPSQYAPPPLNGGAVAEAKREVIEALRVTLFKEAVQWTSGFGGSTGRTMITNDTSTSRVASPNEAHSPKKTSMPIDAKESLRVTREVRDLNSTSPIVEHYLKLRARGETKRGGSYSARSPHKVRSSRLVDAAPATAAAPQPQPSNGTNDESPIVVPPRALTFRDVRTEARRLAERLSSEFARDTKETFAQAERERITAKLMTAGLDGKIHNVNNDKGLASTYANRLTSEGLIEERRLALAEVYDPHEGMLRAGGMQPKPLPRILNY